MKEESSRWGSLVPCCSSIDLSRYLNSKCTPLKNISGQDQGSCVRYDARSMKTCMNISVSIWPVTPVAQATRHGRSSRGDMFSLGLSKAYCGQEPQPNLDRLKVSR